MYRTSIRGLQLGIVSIKTIFNIICACWDCHWCVVASPYSQFLTPWPQLLNWKNLWLWLIQFLLPYDRRGRTSERTSEYCEPCWKRKIIKAHITEAGITQYRSCHESAAVASRRWRSRDLNIIAFYCGLYMFFSMNFKRKHKKTQIQRSLDVIWNLFDLLHWL